MYQSRSWLDVAEVFHNSKKGIYMRNVVLMTCIFLLFGCGVESLGTAATVGKLQADQAKQAKESMDKLKTNINAAMTEAEQSRKKAEEAANN